LKLKKFGNKNIMIFIRGGCRL